MKKFVKENWFKIIITILLLILVSLYGLTVFMRYQNYVSEKKCKSIDSVGEMKKDKDTSGMLDCILKYPSAKDFYKESIKGIVKDKIQENNK